MLSLEGESIPYIHHDVAVEISSVHGKLDNLGEGGDRITKRIFECMLQLVHEMPSVFSDCSHVSDTRNNRIRSSNRDLQICATECARCGRLSANTAEGIMEISSANACPEFLFGFAAGRNLR